MIKSPPKMAGIVIFVLLFSSEYDIFVLNNNVLGVLTMDKIKANLLKAIEGKTNAWQRLSIDDILKLSAAYKNIYEAEMMKQDMEFVDYDSEGEEVKEPEIDGFFIGFCD